MRHRKLLAVAAAMALVALMASVAGGDVRQATTRTTLRLSAGPDSELKFDKTRLRARRGIVTLVMKNPSDLAHAIAVSGKGIKKEGEVVDPGGVSKVRVRLRRTGRYVFYCPVPGHREAGMKGTLTIK